MKEILHVFKNRIMLGVIAGSAALVPLAGMTALATGPAGAATPKGITCSAASGKVNTTTGVAKINLKTCTGNTGGSGKTTGSATSTSGTITWANAKKTTASETTTTGTACKASATLVADEVISGAVTADNTKSTAVGAPVSGEFCANSTATGAIKITLAPGTKFTIAA
jgi:hypothetical protein